MVAAKQLALELGNQRWTLGRASYRRPVEVIRPALYDVAPVGELDAKGFVLTHHYAGTYPAARFRFGLFERGSLVGVAVFSHPVNNRTLTNVFGGEATETTELGRFVLLDQVPGNGETWLLSRCFEQLRGHVRGVVSFSDPVPRTAVDGRVVMPGHVGTIYQAFSARCLGRGARASLRLLPDGTVIAKRALSKIRKRERGWVHAAAVLEAHGADPLGDGDARAWLRRWLPRLTRPLKHPGNHKYAWGLDRATRRALPESKPYPKKRDA